MIENKYHGKPCERGHTLRFRKGNNCVECKRKNYNPVWRRNYQLKKKYGITQHQYEIMLAGQIYGCAICGEDAGNGSGKKFHVDHCHGTGKIRGLLCYTCNIGLGSFQDNPVKLTRAIEYLRERGGV